MPSRQYARNTRNYSGRKNRSVTVRVNDNGRAIGEDHVNAKYLDDDVEHARVLRSEGFSWHQISRMLDMPIRTVRDYCNGTRRNESVAGFKKIKRKKTHA